MLIGGAITDRFSQRTIILISDIIRLLITCLMAVVFFTGLVKMWMMYTFALGFGLVAGFAIPAQNSIVPILVDEKDLQAGNSLMMGLSQLIGFIGPTIAGILIGAYSNSIVGIGLAFSIDSLTFAISAICLWFIRQERENDTSAEKIITSIKKK